MRHLAALLGTLLFGLCLQTIAFRIECSQRDPFNESSANRTFLCDDGRRIPFSWRCDGDIDCENNEDEKECSFACAANEFKCGTFPRRPEFKTTQNPCIPIELRCNSEMDCDDHSDEENCEDSLCSDEEFTCPQNVFGRQYCIPKEWRCDGPSDCLGTLIDEYDCTGYEWKEGYFDCNNNVCIAKEWICNGKDECGDGSDEKNCSSINSHFHGDWNMFQCVNSTDRIPKDWLCDGKPDCKDHSDELGCDFKPNSCSKPYEFACESGNTCISKKWKCDGENDCPNGSDEKNCRPSYPEQCLEDDIVRCPNGVCFSKIFRCDGEKDCADGSDEMGCNVTEILKCDAATQFECTETSHKCIDYQILCKRNKSTCVCSEAALECTTSHHQCKKGSFGCKCHASFVEGNEVCYCEQGWKAVRNETDENAIGWCADVNECEIPGTCDQLCTNLFGIYECACGKGYKLTYPFIRKGRPGICRAVGGDPFIFFSEKASIKKYNLRTETFEPLMDFPGSVVSMDFHVANKTLFWLDRVHKKIMATDLKNKNTRSLISDGVHTSTCIATDWTHNLLFWTSFAPAQINVMDLITQKKKKLLNSDMEKPRDIAVDPELGLMFWIDGGEPAKIERAGMDGNDRQVIVMGNTWKHSSLKWPRGFALDLVKKRVYFGDVKLKGIFSCDYWGQNIIPVVQSREHVNRPLSIAVFENSLFYTDTAFDGVNSVNKFHGGDFRKYVGTVSRPMSVRIFQEQAQPDLENKCLNSGCGESLCLPRAVYSKQFKSQETDWHGKPFICDGGDEKLHDKSFLQLFAFFMLIISSYTIFVIVLQWRPKTGNEEIVKM